MQFMFIKLLIFILALAHIKIRAQPCTPLISKNSSQTIIPQFQASVVSLQAPSNRQRQNQYNVTLRSSTTLKPYEVVVGVTLIENFFDTANFDFSVTAKTIPKSSLFTIVFLINIQSTWTSVHIHYIASSRQDFRVGNFISSNPNLINAGTSSASRTVNVTYFFGAMKWTAESLNASVRAYLTGITYQQRSIDIKMGLSTVNLASSVITISIDIMNQKYSLQSLSLGFIIYSQINNQINLNPVVGSIQSFVEESLNKPTSNSFVGVIRLNSQKVTSFAKNGKRLLSTLPPVPPTMLTSRSQVNIFTDIFQQQGIIFQFVSANDNLPTLGQGFGNLTISNCTSSIRCIELGGFVLNDKTGPKCILCRNNSQYNSTLGSCECKKDFVRDVNNNCVDLSTFCRKDQVYSAGNCYTQTSKVTFVNCSNTQIYNTTTRKCDCRNGYYFYRNRNGVQKCFLPCKNNFVFSPIQQKCICLQNFIDFNGNCIECSGNFSKWNTLLKICECLPGSSMFLDQCYKCDQANGSYDFLLKTCVCKKGFIGTGVICRKNPTPENTPFTIIFIQNTPN